MKPPQENEVKIAVASAARIRPRLRECGFRISRPRLFESNIVLDDREGSLRARNLLLRLRRAGNKVTCTWKGKEIAGPHKRREEREFHVDDLEACLALFQGLGYAPRFRYEKYRTEYCAAGGLGHVMLDETPVGVFLELEGPPRWLDETARALGFSRDDYILLSYGRLFEKWCAEHETDSCDMIFTS